jgi:ribonuclease/clavin/mitogillin
VRPIASQRIAPGIESFAARTPTLPPATHTQSYALGEREVLLVEPATPYADERREWLAWARGIASSGRQLKALFLTHHHPDHVGGAEFFAAELGLPLWAHEVTASLLKRPFDRLVAEGERIVLEGPAAQRWEVLHTPGHAPGHLCLWEPELGSVVVGDMVASVGTIVVAPGEGDMAEYIVQLRRLESLGARQALPAHGEPIAEPSLLFQRYVAHRLMRERKVEQALGLTGAAGADVQALVPTVYDDTHRAAWPLAALSLEAHLTKLVREGRARSDGARYYPAEP